MGNLKQWILKEANNEEIIGVVIGETGWNSYESEFIPNYKNMPKGKLLTWEIASKFLDYEFYSGYGAPMCNAVYAWTKNKVIAISQYDGSTASYSIPRNPCDCMPNMVGG